MLKDYPTIVIVGPTASGKTGAAVRLAQELKGRFGLESEIISADSRAIYKGMDIGTAKPTMEECQGIPHWGLNLVEPGERFTVADWKAYAEQKICSIREAGKIPIVVGGTGLYVDALIFGYRFGCNNEQKSCSLSTAGGEKYPDRAEMLPGFLVCGIKWETEQLRERLRGRLEKMFTQELYAETQRLVDKYGWGSQAMKSDIYEYAWKYMQGELSLAEAKEQCFYRDYHLAKRQITWFKRNEQILWFTLDDFCENVIKCIQEWQKIQKIH